ncbi:neuronal acetylcholine receptor subunit beta-3-like [Acanthaster planci]|uniref:Neuronal acetylcholine receptor subunit beta-3-like n=1 Tax=Acanthaster planci TaxID=133434 RepID=A0A8B7ZJI0_ACAPL|nr:neuronal acetylcholine receptor subunit beta-3-like [Acanthaster planci]
MTSGVYSETAMGLMWTTLVFTSFMMATKCASSRELSNQDRLLKDLLANYGYTSMRPVYNLSHPVTVELVFVLSQVIELNERHQTIEISAWITQRWTDEYMRWNPNDYGGVGRIYVHKYMIWLPDITLYKSADHDFESYKDIPVKVESNGMVTWAAPAILKCTCVIDALLFPFDTQVCEVRFTSWAFNANQLNLTNMTDERKNFYSDVGVWELLDVVVKQRESYYFGESYVELSYFIHLRRKPLFYLLQIIVPCVLFSFLNLMVFVLPPESGEKISLGVTNLLSLIVFNQLISGSLPPTAYNRPIIGYYFTPMIVLACTSVVCTVIVIRLYYRDSSQPIPRGVEYFVFTVLSKLVCRRSLGNISPNGAKSRKGGIASPSHQLERLDSRICRPVDSVRLRTENGVGAPPVKSRYRGVRDWDSAVHDSARRVFAAAHSKTLDSPVMKARQRMFDGKAETTYEPQQTRASQSGVRHTWQEVALVLDRTVLILSLIITLSSITCTVVLFLTYLHSI